MKRGEARQWIVELATRAPTDDCIEWPGALHPATGYGMARPSGYAHREVYLAHVGPIADGLQIDHLCFNRACVNPRHLEAVTSAVNNRRALHARKPRCTECGFDFPPEGPHAACPECVRRATEAREARAQALVDRKERIVALWAEGATTREIAAQVGVRHDALRAFVCRMRKDGYDVPYRIERNVMNWAAA